MKVFIAEKPNLGRAIADVLAEKDPVRTKSREHIEGSGWIVCWAAGHLFELEEPDYYTKLKFPGVQAGANGKIRWSMDHLPIMPSGREWKLKLSRNGSSLFKSIKQHCERATVIVHAGDPDRAGQAIVDNILAHLRVKVPVRRVLISSLEADDVRAKLSDERDNKDFQNLGNSEQCRSRADWLYGMNFSRCVTLKANDTGYRGVVSIGRVQTAVLSLVVHRDEQIANFKPVDYFDLIGNFAVTSGSFQAKWLPRDDQPGLDPDGRLIDQSVSQLLQSKVNGKAGIIEHYSDDRKKESAPMPFSLAQLQMLCGRKYGYTPEQVLATVQSLYETHKCVTYPRVDTGYLPTSLLDGAKTILGNIQQSLQIAPDVVQFVDASRHSAAFNDSKVTAHHGIVPTRQKPSMTSWSAAERDVYREIALRFLAQFMPPREYRAVKVIVAVEGERFSATGSVTTFPGWRLLYAATDIKADSDEGIDLPPVAKGDRVKCNGLDIQAKKTQPPKPFTYESLTNAMINVHRFVTNPKIKEIFERLQKTAASIEEAGLGTPATRHTFVPKLIDIGLLAESKGKGKQKNITSTPAGMALIQALPKSLGTPDVTALWELTLQDIATGKATIEQFMGAQVNYIEKTLAEIQSSSICLPQTEGKSKNYAPSAPRKSSSTGGGKGGGDKTCPDCGKKMVLRNGKSSQFWGCTGYPACKHTEAGG